MQGASMAITRIITDQAMLEDVQTINLAVIPSKMQWNIQIQGAYDLIYPYLHQDYPTREEVFMALQMSFQMHHASNKHFGKYSYNSNTPDAQQTQNIPRETVNLQGEKVRAGSPVNAIGYGTTI